MWKYVRMYSMYVGVTALCSADWTPTGIVADPACGQLNREMNISLSPFVPENLVS